MSKFYDYFITIYFTGDRVYTDYFFNGFKKEVNPYLEQERRASILYNTNIKKILYRGDEADKKRQSEIGNEHISYVDNIFLKLNTIRLKNKDNLYENDVHEAIVLQAIIDFLSQIVYKHPIELGSQNRSFSNPRFAFFIPTHWSEETKQLINKLFIKAGLVNEDDPNKIKPLLFFTEVESIFRYLQSPKLLESEKMDLKIGYGKEYIIAGLKFIKDTFYINLDLFSAQYPPLALPQLTYDTSYVTKIISSASISISLDYGIDSFRECLIIKRFDFQGKKVQQILLELADEYKRQADEYKKQEFISVDGRNIYEYKPFENFIPTKECELESKEVEKIQSLTMENILDVARRTFIRKLNSFFPRHNGETVRPLMMMLLSELPREEEQTEKNFIWKMYCELREWFNNSGRNQHYSLVKFGKESNQSIQIHWRNILMGNSMQIKDEIKMTNAYGYVLTEEVHEKKEKAPFVSISTSENTKLDNMINIAILQKDVKFACSITKGNNKIKETTLYSKCPIYPLSHYFTQLALYLYPVLRISKELDQFMKANSEDLEDIYSDQGNEPESIKKKEIKNEIKKFLSVEPDLIPHESTAIVNGSVIIRKPEKVKLFLTMYLGYLNELVKEKMSSEFEKDWIKQNVGYVISIEKILLDKIMGSKENQQEFLKKSGILQKSNECIKAQIIAQEEGILPVLKRKLDLSFGHKSYFIVTQLHEAYMQITLYMVIHIQLSPQKHTSSTSIVVQDEIIPIENATNELYRNIWHYLNSKGGICQCDQKLQHGNHRNFENHYNLFLKTLKSYVDKIFKQEEYLDMDELHQIPIKTCKCHIHISLRNIIDMGLKPVIQNITTIIAAAIVNTDLFGNYKIDYIFIMGSIFSFSPGLLIQKINTHIFHEEIISSIQSNGKDTPGYILEETLSEVLEPAPNEELHMYDSFCLGIINQISSETYAVYIDDFYENPASGKVSKPFLSCAKYNIDGETIVRDADKAMIVLQKGQAIPNTGLCIQFSMGVGSIPGQDMDSNYVLKLALVRVLNSENSYLGKIISLDKGYYHNLCVFLLVRSRRAFDLPIHFETKYQSHNSFLQFSLRMTGDVNDYESNTKCTTVSQLLEVNYT